MKRKTRKSPLAPLIIVVLILVVLAVLNPDRDAFSAYYQKRTKTAVSEKVGAGALGQLLSSAAGGLASFSADQFKRKNLYVASTYTMTLGGEVREQYLGLAGFFIPLASGK